MEYVPSSRVEATAPTQTPVIEVTARQLEKQIGELQEIAAALESRLTPVLREPEPSQIRPDNPGIASAQSAFAVMLRQRVQEAESIAYRLSSIMRRLEI
jgi:hypothetical protein